MRGLLSCGLAAAAMVGLGTGVNANANAEGANAQDSAVDAVLRIPLAAAKAACDPEKVKLRRDTKSVSASCKSDGLVFDFAQLPRKAAEENPIIAAISGQIMFLATKESAGQRIGEGLLMDTGALSGNPSVVVYTDPKAESAEVEMTRLVALDDEIIIAMVNQTYIPKAEREQADWPMRKKALMTAAHSFVDSVELSEQ